jgi:hypothetical protein
MFSGTQIRDSRPSRCQFTGARAQTPDPQPPGPVLDPARPPLNPFPAEENWSFLADPSKRTDFLYPAKYIPFGDNPQMYLSLGFESAGKRQTKDIAEHSWHFWSL